MKTHETDLDALCGRMRVAEVAHLTEEQNEARRQAEDFAGYIARSLPVTTSWRAIRHQLTQFGKWVRRFDPQIAERIGDLRNVGGEVSKRVAISITAAAIEGDIARIDAEFAGLGIQHRRGVIDSLRRVVPLISVGVLRPVRREQASGITADAPLDGDSGWSGFHAPDDWRREWGRCSEHKWRRLRDEMKADKHPVSGDRSVRFRRSELNRLSLTEPSGTQ